jgi:hypothetical protein
MEEKVTSIAGMNRRYVTCSLNVHSVLNEVSPNKLFVPIGPW